MPPKASTSIRTPTAEAMLKAFSKAYKHLGYSAEEAANSIAKLNAALHEYRQQERFERDIQQIDFHHDPQT